MKAHKGLWRGLHTLRSNFRILSFTIVDSVLILPGQWHDTLVDVFRFGNSAASIIVHLGNLNDFRLHNLSLTFRPNLGLTKMSVCRSDGENYRILGIIDPTLLNCPRLSRKRGKEVPSLALTGRRYFRRERYLP